MDPKENKNIASAFRKFRSNLKRNDHIKSFKNILVFLFWIQSFTST